MYGVGVYDGDVCGDGMYSDGGGFMCGDDGSGVSGDGAYGGEGHLGCH